MHSVSADANVDKENMDLDNSLDLLEYLIETSNHIPHGTLDVPYIGHHFEDIVSYTTLPPDGNCVSLTNMYASYGSGAYLSAPMSTSFSSAATLEPCSQFYCNLPCEASGKVSIIIHKIRYCLRSHQ